MTQLGADQLLVECSHAEALPGSTAALLPEHVSASLPPYAHGEALIPPRTWRPCLRRYRLLGADAARCIVAPVDAAFDPSLSEPMIRQKATGDERDEHVFGFPCPFCGGGDVKLSYGDVWGDRLRVELYCNNPRCEVREFTVLAMYAGETGIRSDVQALELIDERPIERRRREQRERTGEFSFRRAVRPDPSAVLARRTGGVKVQVTDPDE